MAYGAGRNVVNFFTTKWRLVVSRVRPLARDDRTEFSRSGLHLARMMRLLLRTNDQSSETSLVKEDVNTQKILTFDRRMVVHSRVRILELYKQNIYFVNASVGLRFGRIASLYQIPNVRQARTPRPCPPSAIYQTIAHSWFCSYPFK
jgi:hypothetical protein